MGDNGDACEWNIRVSSCVWRARRSSLVKVLTVEGFVVLSSEGGWYEQSTAPEETTSCSARGC